MESVVIIQEELKKQKKLIEAMDGKVNIANLNPTPAEITAGIQSIPSVDLSGSTATEGDVKQGKTFYSGDAFLKTGSAVFDTDITNALFMYPSQEVSYNEEVYFTIPEGINYVKRYCFYENSNYVTVKFNDDITSIDEYAFYKTPNFKYENLNELEKLSFIGMYAFYQTNSAGIDASRLPNSVTNIGSYSFYHAVAAHLDFKMPDSLKTMGQYSFMAAQRTEENSLDLSNFTIKTLPAYTFYNLAFNCDFVAPSTLTTVAMYANYNGCFKNITVNANMNLNNCCFGGNSTHPISNYYLKTVTFEGETPKTIGSNVFATQNLENGFKIYVPDNSLEAYKAVANLAPYKDVIFPMSEKP